MFAFLFLNSDGYYPNNKNSNIYETEEWRSTVIRHNRCNNDVHSKVSLIIQLYMEIISIVINCIIFSVIFKQFLKTNKSRYIEPEQMFI